MILVKIKSNALPLIIINGDKNTISKKINQLELYCWNQIIYFDKIENLGFNGGYYEYYAIYESEERMKIYLEI